MYGSAKRAENSSLVGQPLERVVHALRRLVGGGEEFHARAVGLFFVRALIGEQRAADHFLRRGQRGRADIPGTRAAALGRGDHRADAEHDGDDRLGGGVPQLLAHLGEMAAGDMTGFMRQHADDFVRRRRFAERSGIDEDAAAVGDECVEGALVDDDDADVLLRQAGGAQDRRAVVAKQLLDLRVADDRQALRLVPEPAIAASAATANAARREAGVMRRPLIGLSAIESWSQMCR